MKKIDYSLYLVTDSDLMSSDSLEIAVALAIQGGVTMVQLREKKATSKDFLATASRVKKITSQYQVPLIINDRVDIALAVGADGVHIGQDDLPLPIVRQLLGPEKIIGVSASNLAEAQTAMVNGADYLGVGAMYATATKRDATLTSMAELAKIRATVALPIVVIGGITKETMPDFKGTGVDGFAVVSAIIAQPDIREAAASLKGLIKP